MSVDTFDMIAVTATDTPERSIYQLILGIGFLLIAIGHFYLDYPPLFISIYALLGVAYLLEYSSTRVRRVVYEFRSQVSNLTWGTFWAGFGAILFWRYEYRLWAIGSLFLGVILLCGLFVRHVQNR